MSAWENLSIAIELKEQGGKTVWVFTGEPSIEGMHNILSHYGAMGYELVAVTPEFSKNVGNNITQVMVYRAFFKRIVSA